MASNMETTSALEEADTSVCTHRGCVTPTVTGENMDGTPIPERFRLSIARNDELQPA